MNKVSVSHPTDRPNYCEVTIGDVIVAFSYRTPIGFIGPNGKRTSENLWGPTTGKHLNYWGGTRIPRGQFERELSEALAPLGVTIDA